MVTASACPATNRDATRIAALTPKRYQTARINSLPLVSRNRRCGGGLTSSPPPLQRCLGQGEHHQPVVAAAERVLALRARADRTFHELGEVLLAVEHVCDRRRFDQIAVWVLERPENVPGL